MDSAGELLLAYVDMMWLFWLCFGSILEIVNGLDIHFHSIVV
jgi:hypothetical protein